MPRPAASFTLRGTQRMQSLMDQIARNFTDDAARALRTEAEHIMTRSKQEFVPVDVGNLKNSGHVADVERKGKDISVQLAFGGSAAPYALAVHEHPSKHSPPTWGEKKIQFKGTPQAGPKYLERPFKEALKDMDRRIADEVKL